LKNSLVLELKHTAWAAGVRLWSWCKGSGILARSESRLWKSIRPKYQRRNLQPQDEGGNWPVHVKLVVVKWWWL